MCVGCPQPETIGALFDGMGGLAVGGVRRPRPVEVVAPPPPTGNVIEFTGTISYATLQSAVDNAAPGPLTVRHPTGGQFTVANGNLVLRRQDLTIQDMILTDGDLYTDRFMQLAGATAHTSDRFTLKNSTIHCAHIDGVDGWTWDNVSHLYRGVTYDGYAAGTVVNRASNWTIKNSFFSGSHVIANESQHSEALFFGAGSTNILIQDCTFDDNGTTGHMFWSWFDFNPFGNSPTPTNICVHGCHFTRVHNPWFHTQVHTDLSALGDVLNIRIDTASCTFDASATMMLGNQNGEVTWYHACTTAV